jgi:hypothetical protein
MTEVTLIPGQLTLAQLRRLCSQQPPQVALDPMPAAPAFVPARRWCSAPPRAMPPSMA